ncbi:heme o synthase [Zeimonas arvi]|uniref:Protoheme IX farnesyltransferase n=1 Tax=Zeimonas arvi TaxID=2498847 RepID=A0A5C8NP97_9BURK|nr:heme o synthase [Zeimonas arvi]TXL62651.1 protoheme IX farnesyltransferase [Zeimonas arvi]
MKALLNLFKLRIGVAIALTAVAGLMISPGGQIGGWQAAVLTLAVLLSSSAAGAFNQFYEVDLDARMGRTSRRPFVTGRFRHHGGWLALIVALTGIAVAAAWYAANALAALYTFLGAFVYAVVYTVWLKRRSAWNIVIGGLAGSFAVLAGAAAVQPALSVEAMLLAVVLFLWTPPHFWSLSIVCRDDYAKAGVPMLPVVRGERFASWAIFLHAVVMVGLSLAIAAWSPGWLYFACAATGGGLLVSRTIALLRAPGRATALASFHASLVQLSLLLLGTIADAWMRNAMA